MRGEIRQFFRLFNAIVFRGWGQRRLVEMAFSALDGGAFHFHRSVALVELVVEPTGVADGISSVVSAPKWSDGGATIEACYGHVRVFGTIGRCTIGGGIRARRQRQVLGGFVVGIRMFVGVLLDHHPVVVSRAPSARSRSSGSVTVAIASTRALL